LSSLSLVVARNQKWVEADSDFF